MKFGKKLVQKANGQAKKLLSFTGISSCPYCSALLDEIKFHSQLKHPENYLEDTTIHIDKKRDAAE